MQEDLREAALLESDELSRGFDRDKLRALVLAAGQPPLIVRRLLYFKGEMFKGDVRCASSDRGSAKEVG